MEPAHSLTTRIARRDGWTPERRRQFLELLAAGTDVRRACGRVGLSREGAYRLRRRDCGFARAWDGARRSARVRDEAAFYAMLPEKVRRILSQTSGGCELREGRDFRQDTVPGVPSV